VGKNFPGGPPGGIARLQKLQARTVMIKKPHITHTKVLPLCLSS